MFDSHKRGLVHLKEGSSSYYHMFVFDNHQLEVKRKPHKGSKWIDLSADKVFSSHDSFASTIKITIATNINTNLAQD